MRYALDSLIMIGSFLSVFLWEKFDFHDLTLPLIGVLVFLYIASNVSQKALGRSVKVLPHESFHAAILVMTSILLISSTGNLSSPFFFLIYFLPFTVSYLLSPMSSITFSLAASIFFFPSLVEADYIRAMTQIGSVIALSPIAYWAGSEYRHHIAELSHNRAVAAKVVKDIGKIISDDTNKLSPNESKALTDILNQVETLKK